MKRETIAIHGGFDSDPATKAVAVPIYQTAAYSFDSAEHGAALFNLEVPGYRYSHISNPTSDVLEDRVAQLEGGVAALSAAMAYDFFHHRVRVNTVIPGGGGIVSGMSLGRVGGDAARFGKGAPGTAAGRVATGEDVANVVAFLLSPEAETLSGTVIDVGCFAQQGGPIPAKPTP